jgi:large subunit ribosomal protein L10
MKSRETKQRDLTALQEQLQNSKSALLVSFSGLTVGKDQEFRKSIREAGAQYQVVKNTLARIAVKGTQFEGASDYFKGVTAIAWTQEDPVVLTKAVSKFLKDNAEVYKYKSGVVDGKVIDFTQLQTIANLPSKEELIAKLLYVLNSSAQRIVTVINAVPRDLAIVIKQIGDAKPADAAAPAAEAKPDTVPDAASEATTVEAATVEAPAVDAPAEAVEAAPGEGQVEAAPVEETAETASANEETMAPAEVEAGAVGAAPTTDGQAADDAAVEASEASAAEPAENSTEAESEAVAAAPENASEALIEEADPVQPEAAVDGEATE